MTQPTDYARIGERLRFDIVSGVFAPGERLKIGALQARYGAGMIPIREAIQQLRGEGLVTVEPNRGATVRLLDEAFIRSAIEVRIAFDYYFTRRFVEIGSFALIDRLKKINEQLAAALDADDGEASIELNRLFHGTIFEASGNEEALSIFRRYSLVTLALRRNVGFSTARKGRIIADHEGIIEAFEARNGDLASARALAHSREATEELISQYLAARDGGVRKRVAGAGE